MSNPATRVLFVCTGNICRSPLAEAVLAHEFDRRGLSGQFHVDSAGTDAYHVGDPPDIRMRSLAKSHGVILRGRSRRFRPQEFDKWDHVFAMDTGHYRMLERYSRTSEDRAKFSMFRAHDPVTDDRDFPDVPDPWYGTMDDFEWVYEIVSRTCVRIADELSRRRSGVADD